MKSLYSAFNRKNYDELRTLWLPDDNVELTMPGYSKARGPNDVQKLYRQIVKDARPFGSVEAKVVAVNSNGFVAVVQTVEVVAPGTDLKVRLWPAWKPSNRRMTGTPTPLGPTSTRRC